MKYHFGPNCSLVLTPKMDESRCVFLVYSEKILLLSILIAFPNYLCMYCAVEYWRNRYQRMNKERFVAANVMALITHGIVSSPVYL